MYLVMLVVVYGLDWIVVFGLVDCVQVFLKYYYFDQVQKDDIVQLYYQIDLIQLLQYVEQDDVKG